VIQVASGKVVVTLLAKAFDKAGGVAGVGISHAIADLLPAIVSALGAATRAEQVVVEFVVAGGFRTVEDGHRSALQTNDDGLVLLVREDVTAQAVLLPAKVFGIVESTANLLPLSCTKVVRVCIVGHPGEAQDCLFIRHIWSSYFVVRPGRRR
jgi:hypothetical protein